MISTKLTTTVQIPSRFGVPGCGASFGDLERGTDGRGTDVRGTTVPVVIRDWTIVMDAADAATKGHLGLVPAYFPGTPAWRPPTC